MFEWITGCITTILVVAMLCISLTYCGLDNNERWYTAQRICIENGGSWVAGGNASPQCIRGISR